MANFGLLHKYCGIGKAVWQRGKAKQRYRLGLVEDEVSVVTEQGVYKPILQKIRKLDGDCLYRFGYFVLCTSAKGAEHVRFRQQHLMISEEDTRLLLLQALARGWDIFPSLPLRQTDPTHTQPSREIDLKERLAAAKEAYERARGKATELISVAGDAGYFTADGKYSVLNAVKSERAALSHYFDARAALNAFFLNGRMPRGFQ